MESKTKIYTPGELEDKSHEQVKNKWLGLICWVLIVALLLLSTLAGFYFYSKGLENNESKEPTDRNCKLPLKFV